MKKREVVVTGLGVVSAIGIGMYDFWNAVKEGKNGVEEITLCDKSLLNNITLAAEVKNFNITDYIQVARVKRMARFTQFALVAAEEAIKDSKLNLEEEDSYKTGVIVSSGICSMPEVENNVIAQSERGYGAINPLLIPIILPNMASANIAIRHKLKGKNMNITTACTSGNNSIGEALRTIQFGDADIMIAGGAESTFTPISINGFAALSALSTSKDPSRASIPFDKERNGFVLGEGAGIAILEEKEHAIKRGAKIYAEVLGYASNCDAYHITAPSLDGESQAECMRMAIKDSSLKVEDIDYINAHGTSTKYNDKTETLAIKKCFGEHAAKLKINSSKSMFGHLLGGAGGIEFVVLCKSVEEDFIHKTINYQVYDEECDLDYVVKDGLRTKVNYALSNGFGFGGHNATVVIGKYKKK